VPVTLINENNRKWIILFAASLAFGLIMLDETVVAVALPTIQHDLSMSLVLSHWVINSYLLVIAGFIAVGGKLGDIIGYRTLFVAGVLIFGIFSLAAGFAQSATWILTARALQGFGAAVIFPASMALLALTFPASQRGLAMGVYGAIGSIFIALGPLVGGFLTDEISWRWIFWINVPVIAIIILVFLASWREPTFETARPKIDLPGLVTLVLGITPLVTAIMQGAEWGWDSYIIILLFIMSAVMLTLFYIIELRAKEPLIEVDLFRNETFLSSNLAIFTGQFTKIAVIVFGALYFQEALKMNPLQAGAALLPAMIPIPIVAVISGRLTDKYGPRYPTLSGLLISGVALLLMGLTVGSDSYRLLVPTLILWGISLSSIFAPALTAVMLSVPNEKQGQASGIVLTAQIFGAAIGLAILSALLQQLHNYRPVFLLTSGIVFFTLIVGWMYLGRKNNQS